MRCVVGLYEVYESAEAVDLHRQTDHYAVWTAKDSGGVVSVNKITASPAAADWCFQG